jgi:hypothetical protein
MNVASLMLVVLAGSSAPLRVEIVTRILPPDPQAGMKSTQTLVVDFQAKRITPSFSTGSTQFPVVGEFGSLRDRFQVKIVNFSEQRVTFTVKGETASAVAALIPFMPNINYKFDLTLTSTGTGELSGCHDGYPAYAITVGGEKIYEYLHPRIALLNLYGSCDIEVLTKHFPQSSAPEKYLEFIVAASSHVNSASCQSYALAFNLSMLDPSPLLASYSWRVDDVEDLRALEAAIRTEIEQEMKARLDKTELSSDDVGVSEDWRRAIERLTFNEYTLKGEEFSSLEELMEFLTPRVPIKSRSLQSFTLSRPTRTFLTSVTRIGPDTYPGQLVTILGMEALVSQQPPSLLLVNSFAPTDDNECLPEYKVEYNRQQPWRGVTSWTEDYDLKESPKYRVDWVAPTR